MTPHEKSTRELVAEWVALGEDDLRQAGILVSHEPPGLRGTAFLSQQCAEKYLKAFLVAHEVDHPRTHDLKELLILIGSIDAALAESVSDARALNPYGVTIRYPSDFPDMSVALAKEALEIASKVSSAVREALADWLGKAENEADGERLA